MLQFKLAMNKLVNEPRVRVVLILGLLLLAALVGGAPNDHGGG